MIYFFFSLFLLSSPFLICQEATQRSAQEVKWKNLAYSFGARERLKHTDFVKEITELLEVGIEPDLKLTTVNHDTMLSRAAEYDNCSDVVELLLSRNAQADQVVRDVGSWVTPLHIAARSKALANLAKLLPYYKDVNPLDSSKNSPLQILLIEVYWDYIDAKRDPKDFVPIFKAFIQKGALTNIPFGTHQAPNGFQNLFQLIQALHCPELEVAHQDAQVKP